MYDLWIYDVRFILRFSDLPNRRLALMTQVDGLLLFLLGSVPIRGGFPLLWEDRVDTCWQISALNRSKQNT